MNNLCAFTFLWKAPPLRGINSIIFTVLTVLLSLFLVSCADIFQPKIPFSGKNEPSSLGDFFRYVDNIEKLQPPEQFYIAPFYSPSAISLTWAEVRGAAYYMVERAVALPIPGSNTPAWYEPEDGDYEPLNRFVYNTSYTDEILKNPALDSDEYQNIYYYRVSAFNTARKFEESDPTEPQPAMLFRSPRNVRASGGTSVDHVQLNWDRTDGAVSYEIWRSDFSNGVSATMLGTVLGNQNWYQNIVNTVEQGKDFYYMITAVNRFGYRTLQTRPAYGYARIFGAPDAPSNVRLEDSNDNPSGRGHSRTEINIKWDPVDESDAYYAVYRYSSVDSSLTRLIAKIENDTFYTDNVGLRPGVYYYYRVQAIIDDIETDRALRSELSFPDPEGFLLSSPDLVVAEKDETGNVIVKWQPAMGTENERAQYKYKVYSDTGITGNFQNLIGEVTYPVTDGQGFISLAITGAAGHTFFKVSTVNATVKGDVESDKSTVVSPSPSAAVIVDVSCHAFINEKETANSSGVYPVRITWKKPDNETPAFYQIQRSTRPGASFSRVNEALPAIGPYNEAYFYNDTTGIYTFIDRNENARVARKYYYRVLSLNQLEQGNFPSGERIGWGALTHEQWIAEFNKTYSSAIYKLTLMHRPSDTDKLGTETKYGTISGDIYYNARIAGLGGDITVRQTNYADFYIENDPANGVYFILNGNSGSEANMSGNGKMKNETITCTGMYPGQIYHGGVQLTGGKVSGGTYRVTPNGFAAKELTATIYGYAAGK